MTTASPTVSTHDEKRLKALELESRVEGHIERSESGLFVLDSKLDLDPEEHELVERSLHYLNSQTSPSAPERGILLKAAADGYTPALGWSRGWTQWSLAIDGKTTKEVASAAGMGAGVAAIVAAISTFAGNAPVAVVAAIAAGVLGFEAGFLQLQNTRSNDHGVYWWGLNGSILSPPLLTAECAIVWSRKKS